MPVGVVSNRLDRLFIFTVIALTFSSFIGCDKYCFPGVPKIVEDHIKYGLTSLR